MRRRQRSIPAWAGETWTKGLVSAAPRVYPRVGGGNPKIGITYCGPRVYPRVGGGNTDALRPHTISAGLSPRGRGKPGGFAAGVVNVGSIPAWAGETYATRCGAHKGQVYPRVGGGNQNRHLRPLPSRGLSPRGRGKQVKQLVERQRHGSIPAWAGETRCRSLTQAVAWVYPRVGGGNTLAAADASGSEGLSPRGRGKQVGKRHPTAGDGSIPAWAGETRAYAAPAPREEVYPRVGGGNREKGQRADRDRGLSPRGRGKLIATSAR